jgi:DNA-binding response OmpR family regulator
MEGPLTDEFRQALAEVRMGRPRREALRDLATRADAQPVSNFVGAIVQAEQLGVPIAKVLQIQSNQLRIERRQRAEEAAAKAPVKMLVPMVGCIFPTIFIVILGPAVVTIMGGGTGLSLPITMLPPVRPVVLLVDDDLTLLAVTARRIARAGFDVRTASSGSTALRAIEGAWPSLVIVDVMMPGMDGFELCRRIKQIADLPIIILSAVDESEAKISALELYAEDYVTKPFDPDELVARIQRVLRRAAVGTPQISLDAGEIEVDLATRRLVTREGTTQLTPTESRLLQVLAASIDRIVSTDELLSRVWTDADGADPAYLWVTVRRLRRKLEPDPDNPRYLSTERGIGYRLVSSSYLTQHA